MRRWWPFAVAVVAALSSCGASDAGPKAARATKKLEYPVETTTLAKTKVQYTVSAPGSIEAFQQVQITSRVAGAVDKVAFAEGQIVRQGQVLVVIDAERFQVAVDLAKATLARADAAEKNTEAELARRKGADGEHPGLIPGEELSTFATGVLTAKADVEGAKQAVRVAELNLRDANVRAPIAGIIQTRTVQTGQYLATGTVLATLLQRDPLLLRFAVTEQDAPRIKPGMTATLTLRESAHSYDAKITLVAEAADPTTRLVPVTATIDDGAHPYWLRPGAFCGVTVPVGAARDAIVVPTIAVQPTEAGNVTWVVVKSGGKDAALARPVELGMHTADGNVEVTRGLAPGEQLVVRGYEPLSDGAPVKVGDPKAHAKPAGEPAPATEKAP